jgi:hypothetical protein
MYAPGAARLMREEQKMAFEGYVEYQRREFCKDQKCPLQSLLDAEGEDTPKGQQVRGICKSACIHTTYEFHHWLIQKGYLLVRPTQN